jgi:hypothetical protein
LLRPGILAQITARTAVSIKRIPPAASILKKSVINVVAFSFTVSSSAKLFNSYFLVLLLRNNIKDIIPCDFQPCQVVKKKREVPIVQPIGYGRFKETDRHTSFLLIYRENEPQQHCNIAILF